MTIQEILEAHERWEYTDVEGEFLNWTLKCEGCEWTAKNVGDGNKEAHRAHVSEVLEAHMQEREARLRQLVRDMTDPGACWFDHHGGCQEHGYLSLKPGELCPHAEAKQLLGDNASC